LLERTDDSENGAKQCPV